MKYASDMCPVCNDAEHVGLLVVYSARHRCFLARVVYVEGATSKVDNCNEVGSQLPHRAHISRASCLKKLSRAKVLEF